VTLMLVRLALSGIRSRLPSSVLTVLVTGSAAATIVIALSMGATISDPWQRTFAAANGAHIQANVPAEADAERVAGMPGVTQADKPVPVAQATLLVDGEPTRVIVAGLSGQEQVNVPLVTSGERPADGSILLERSLAGAIQAGADTALALESASGTIGLEFAGEAISPSQPRYPRSNPGLVWVTRTTFERLLPNPVNWHWIENLRLENPGDAPRFAASASGVFSAGTVSVQPWQEMQATALQETQPFQVILIGYTALLLVVSAAIIGIVIGARAANQAREIAIFKSIGFTPRQVASVYTLEVALLALAGAVIGFVPGVFIAPVLARTTASTLLTSPERSTSFDRLLIAAAVVVPIAGSAAYRSARRSANRSVAEALRSGATPLRPASRLGRFASLPVLPVSAMLGLRDLAARRRRIVWLLLVILLTGSALVATICAQAAVDKATAAGVTDIPSELTALIYSLDGVLAIASSSALVAVGLLMVRERVRDIGILRAIGMAPGQVVTTVAGTLAVVALVAGVLAIPVGLGLYTLLYTATGSDEAIDLPPWWALASAPLVLVIATLITTAIPARLAVRVPVAQAIRQDS
jgi:putative ABC transport system permease protein